MKKSNLIFILVASITLAFIHGHEYPIRVPKNWPQPFYNFSKKPLTKSTVELGRRLFYDPVLSLDSSISCASCHSPYSAFTHIDHQVSHGIYDQFGNRNSPALMNLAWQQNFMWDGAINRLDKQAMAPITHPKEMGETMSHVLKKLQASKSYPPLFKKAFLDSVITTQNTFMALSQFLLTLFTSNSKYDSVMNKLTSFTQQEENGYRLFQKNCASCHTEPLFSNYQFENNGLQVDTVLTDMGRMTVTKNKSDSLKFKVPSLRNIEFTSPYMHDGRFKKLSQVLNHYTNGVQHSLTLAKQLQKPILLSAEQKVDLIAFLITLSDRSFLFNELHAFPKPNRQ